MIWRVSGEDLFRVHNIMKFCDVEMYMQAYIFAELGN